MALQQDPNKSAPWREHLLGFFHSPNSKLYFLFVCSTTFNFILGAASLILWYFNLNPRFYHSDWFLMLGIFLITLPISLGLFFLLTAILFGNASRRTKPSHLDPSPVNNNPNINNTSTATAEATATATTTIDNNQTIHNNTAAAANNNNNPPRNSVDSAQENKPKPKENPANREMITAPPLNLSMPILEKGDGDTDGITARRKSWSGVGSGARLNVWVGPPERPKSISFIQTRGGNWPRVPLAEPPRRVTLREAADAKLNPCSASPATRPITLREAAEMSLNKPSVWRCDAEKKPRGSGRITASPTLKHEGPGMPDVTTFLWVGSSSLT